MAPTVSPIFEVGISRPCRSCFACSSQIWMRTDGSSTHPFLMYVRRIDAPGIWTGSYSLSALSLGMRTIHRSAGH